ncbi:MAG: hypothetical protein ABIG61_07965 [Planctomycetota bacterium]
MTNLDWTIAAALTSVLVVAVILSRKFTKDVASFIVGGRKTRMWLALSNDNSGGFGLIAVAYAAQEGFRHGFSIIWIYMIGALLVIFLFGIFGFGIQRFRATRAMTAGQFHEQRYSRGLRLLVGIALGLGGVLNMAAFPIVGAQFLCAFLGWPAQFDFMGVTLPTIPVLCACMIALAVFFAVVCGQVGVIITDYIQGLVIMAGLFAVNYILFANLGVANIKTTLETQMGNGAFNPFIRGSYGLLWASWLLFTQITGPFCSGPQITKYASADNPKVVRRMMLVSKTFNQGKALVKLSLGVGAFVALGTQAIPKGMEPSFYERIVTPTYLNSVVPPIMMGLLFSAFIFAFISTNDSYLLSWSSIIVNDVVCLIHKKALSTKRHLWTLRVTIICIGLFLFFWGVLFTPPTTILNYLMLTGTMLTGAAVAMLAGLYWRRANTTGAYAAVLTTMILPPLDLVFRNISPHFYHLKVPAQVAGIGTICLSVILLTIFSLASSKPTKWVDYGEVVRKSESND